MTNVFPCFSRGVSIPRTSLPGLNTKWPNCFPAFVFWTKLASLFLNSSSLHFCLRFSVTHRQSKRMCEMVQKLTLNISNGTSFCLHNSLNLPSFFCTYFGDFSKIAHSLGVAPSTPCQVSNKAFPQVHLWKIHESRLSPTGHTSVDLGIHQTLLLHPSDSDTSIGEVETMPIRTAFGILKNSGFSNDESTNQKIDRKSC